MPTVAERRIQIDSKVERAKEHARNLEAELGNFSNSNPVRIETKRDPQTQRMIYYVEDVEPVPVRLSLLAGDAIQNLMSALDHLAYQLVCSDTGDQPPQPNRIYFPIADDFAKYEAKKKAKMQGADPNTTISAIDNLKPYRGGNDPLWMLYRLNNVEKHRLLFTIQTQSHGVNMGAAAAPQLKHWPKEVVESLISMGFFLNEADPQPLTHGVELFLDLPGAEFNPRQQFRFQVTLKEVGIAEGKPLIETIHQLTTAVDGAVAALIPFLK